MRLHTSPRLEVNRGIKYSYPPIRFAALPGHRRARNGSRLVAEGGRVRLVAVHGGRSGGRMAFVSEKKLESNRYVCNRLQWWVNDSELYE
jgi:hypothetical protein